MKKLRVNKIALSVATAFLMLTSFLSAFASAAGSNYITLSADKQEITPGEAVYVYVDLDPSATGVAAFTADLHYDASKLSVYVPNEGELQTSFKPNSKFTLSADYTSESGVIRIAGISQSGNVTEKSQICIAEFIPDSSAKGGAAYWLEIQNMVKAQGDSYAAVSCEGNLNSSPISVNIKNDSPAETKASTEKTSETKVTTAKETTKASETTTAKTSETKKSETTKATSETTSKTSSAKETTASKTETSVTKTETSETKKTSSSRLKSVKGADDSSAAASEITVETKKKAAESTTAKTSKATAAATEAPKAIFEHKQGSSDFNSETNLQYGFALSDYIKDYSKNYDITVDLSSTGNVTGGIGMVLNGQWVYERSPLSSGKNIKWTLKNVDPAASNGTAFVQIFYLSANSDLKVNSITAVPVKDETAKPKQTQPASPVGGNGEANTTASSQTSAGGNGESAAYGSNYDGDTEETTASQVQKAAAQASQPDNTNPYTGNDSTGQRVMNVLTFFAAAYVLYSVFAIFYNRFGKKVQK